VAEALRELSYPGSRRLGGVEMLASHTRSFRGCCGAASTSCIEHENPMSAIELEAECCSLDSLGAFTDEHYCGPAVTRSMHSNDT
jgi:hypothetical protein